MPNGDDLLSKAREKYGAAVANMSDRELATMLHQAIAPDVPFGVFTERNGIEIEKPGMAGAVLRSGLQGLTANFSDELRGVGAAVIPGGDTYTSAVEKERSALSEARAAYPKSTLAAEIGGGLLTALTPVGGAGLVGGTLSKGQLAARMAGLGAAEGALFGAGAGEGAGGKAMGATAGAVLGAVASPVAAIATKGARAGGRFARDVVRGGDAPADAAKLLSSITRAENPSAFVGAGGRAIPEEDALRALAAQADPEAIMAEAGYGPRRALRGSMAINNPRNAAMRETLGARAETATDDVADALRIATGKSEVDEYAIARNLSEQKRLNAAGVYDAAYQVGAIADDEINRSLLILRDTDSISEVAKDWKRILEADDILARRTGASPAAGRDRALIAMDANGAVLLNPEYATVRNLDTLKRSMDRTVTKVFKDGNYDLGKQLAGLRDDIVNRLDDVVPEYKVARKSFAGDLEAERAFNEGVNAAKSSGSWPPSRIRDYMNGLDDASKDLFRTAYFSKEMERALAKRGGILAHFRSPTVMPRLRAVFDDDLALVEQKLRRATELTEVRNVAESGSRTAPVLEDIKVVGGARELTPALYAGAGQYGAGLRNLLFEFAARPSVQRNRAAEMIDLLAARQPAGYNRLADMAAARTARNQRDNLIGSRAGALAGYGVGQIGGLLGRGSGR